MIRSNTQHSYINIVIAANQAGMQFTAIRQCDLDTFGPLYYVGVGEDLSIGSKDEA